MFSAISIDNMITVLMNTNLITVIITFIFHSNNDSNVFDRTLRLFLYYFPFHCTVIIFTILLNKIYLSCVFMLVLYLLIDFHAILSGLLAAVV